MWSRKKNKRRVRKKGLQRGWVAFSARRRSAIVRGAAWIIVAIALLWGGSTTLSHLEARVDARLNTSAGQPVFSFVDLPPELRSLALGDLTQSLTDLRSRPWTQRSLCRAMGERLVRVGWVERLNHVRRAPGVRFEISASYRMPVAMIQRDNAFFLVDRKGIRLPGSYRHDDAWMLIQGVEEAPSPAGQAWPGEDLQAALAVLSALTAEPYAREITAVLVDNFAGRIDPRRAHVVLATDRAGGRIYWGSAPGKEIEENTVAQKLAILRANYLTTGRADAGHVTIDVSTFPDRFTLPG